MQRNTKESVFVCRVVLRALPFLRRHRDAILLRAALCVCMETTPPNEISNEIPRGAAGLDGDGSEAGGDTVRSGRWWPEGGRVGVVRRLGRTGGPRKNGSPRVTVRTEKPRRATEPDRARPRVVCGGPAARCRGSMCRIAVCEHGVPEREMEAQGGGEARG